MSVGSTALGSESLGSEETLADAVGGGILRSPLGGTRQRRRIARAIRHPRRGGEVTLLMLQQGEGMAYATGLVRVVLRTLRPEEIVGDLRQSDMSAILSPELMKAAGLREYLTRRDRIVRYPDTAREMVYSVQEEPQHIAVADEVVVIRAVLRGGSGAGI